MRSETAGLYGFAEACGCAVICFAHVTNEMGTIEGDFEKGAANGTTYALDVLARTVAALSVEFRGYGA